MKKVLTITCHEVYNYGATLQEYALLEFLRIEGYKSEVIHYKPNYLSGHLKLWAVSPRYNKPILRQIYQLIKLPKRLINLQRKKAFDDFSKKYISSGKVLYKNNEELKANLPKADAYICGSDQIWNSFFENGKDPAFYLNFVPDNKLKISYGASFAIDELEEEVKPFVSKNVKRLNAVSVRETSGLDILKKIGIDQAVQVLDPVFLLSEKHWRSRFVHQIDDDFILVYDFDSNPKIKEMALELKKLKGYKIYTVNDNIDYADCNFWLKGPETFLSLISQSKINLTNSFHAVAFSLIFKKQFVVVNRTEKINTRMRDLLELVGLPNLLLDKGASIQLDSLSIDYGLVETKIESKIDFSKIFLINALKKMNYDR